MVKESLYNQHTKVLEFCAENNTTPDKLSYYKKRCIIDENYKSQKNDSTKRTPSYIKRSDIRKERMFHLRKSILQLETEKTQGYEAFIDTIKDMIKEGKPELLEVIKSANT